MYFATFYMKGQKLVKYIYILGTNLFLYFACSLSVYNLIQQNMCLMDGAACFAEVNPSKSLLLVRRIAHNKLSDTLYY